MPGILNLKQYDIVFATSFETKHGITGHLYEMIEYYVGCKQNGIRAGIALLDGVTTQLLQDAIATKYDFSDAEIGDILNDTIEHLHPNIIMANTMCIVDGAPRFGSCTIYCEHMFLLRCWDGPLDYFHNHKSIKRTHLLQDFSVYEERYENLNIDVVDYNKKLLWNRYVKPKPCLTNTAMFYMMNRCKARPAEEVAEYISKLGFDEYIIVTDTPERYQHLEGSNVRIEVAPTTNLFEKFSTYIYTPVAKVDCSPRFIVECAVFGREVLYAIDYTDPGVEARRRGIDQGIETLLLKQDDAFFSYVKDYM